MNKTQTPIEQLASKGPNGAKLAAAMIAQSKAGWTLDSVKKAVAKATEQPRGRR